MTLLTAGALTDPRLPATASNVCMTDAMLGDSVAEWLRAWDTLTVFEATVCGRS